VEGVPRGRDDILANLDGPRLCVIGSDSHEISARGGKVDGDTERLGECELNERVFLEKFDQLAASTKEEEKIMGEGAGARMDERAKVKTTGEMGRASNRTDPCAPSGTWQHLD
jgi:hypothetical protein